MNYLISLLLGKLTWRLRFALLASVHLGAAVGDILITRGWVAQRLIGRDEAAVMAFCRTKRPALAALRALCEHVPSASLSPSLLPHILSWMLPLLYARTSPRIPFTLVMTGYLSLYDHSEVGAVLSKNIGQFSRECISTVMGFLLHLLGTFFALPPSEYPLQVHRCIASPNGKRNPSHR